MVIDASETRQIRHILIATISRGDRRKPLPRIADLVLAIAVMFPNATMVTVPTMVVFAVVPLIIRVPPPNILPAVYTHDGERIPMLVPTPSIRIADCAGILNNGRTTKLARRHRPTCRRDDNRGANGS
jgi:hypothetical protein